MPRGSKDARGQLTHAGNAVRELKLDCTSQDEQRDYEAHHYKHREDSLQYPADEQDFDQVSHEKSVALVRYKPVCLAAPRSRKNLTP
jgi:hypothetical protein